MEYQTYQTYHIKHIYIYIYISFTIFFIKNCFNNLQLHRSLPSLLFPSSFPLHPPHPTNILIQCPLELERKHNKLIVVYI